MSWASAALPGGTLIHYGTHDAVPPLLRGHYGTLVQLKVGRGPQGEYKYRVLLKGLGPTFYAEAQEGWFTTMAPDAVARLDFCMSHVPLGPQRKALDQALQKVAARVYPQSMAYMVPDLIWEAVSPEALHQAHRSRLRSKKARAELAALWEAARAASVELAQALVDYVETE